MALKSFGLVERQAKLSIINRPESSNYYKNKENMKLSLKKKKHAKVVSCLLLLSIIIFMEWFPLTAEARGGGGGGSSGIYPFERIGRNYTNVAKPRDNDTKVLVFSKPMVESGGNESVESEDVTRRSVSSSVSIVASSASQNQKKREIKLPLENLFPSTNSATSATTTYRPGGGGGGSKSAFESLKIPAHQRQYLNDREKLKSALLNHSLHSHEDDDKALDRLVFSQLPEGSKLILRTVKIVRTDDDGNEEDAGDEVTSWDVVLSNGTKAGSSNGNQNVDEEEEDEEEFVSDEEDEDSGTNQKKHQQQLQQNNHDLISAASHPTSHYNSHGSNLQTKDKTNKYYDEKDHGKHRAQTFTDTEGTKVKNYKGTEKGLTDFDNAHGNAQSNEGGRFKDSKKKNKGRKVTGFKRVYHKEEFQRTEHFYDDEDLKRIAEQFGSNDQKEKSSHGLKDDERKYHGIYKEHTDGEKVKNEKGTQDSFNKGHHQSQKNAEQHKHGQNFAQHQGSAVYGGRTGHHPANHHANHNYDGAYSTNKNKLANSPNNNGGSLTDPTKMFSTTSSSSLPLTENPKAQQSTSVSSHPDSKATQRQVKSVSSSSSTGSKLPTMAMMAPDPQILLAKPSEMKVFFSPRERYFPYKENDATMAYAPNFGPGHNQHHNGKKPGGNRNGNYKFKPPQHPHSKPLYGPKIHNFNHNPRYAGNFPLNSKDIIPPLYSTIIKTLPHGNLISIDKSKEHPVIVMENVASTTERTKKAVGRYRIRPQLGWIPIGGNNNNNNNIKHKDPLAGGTRDRPQIGFTKNPLSNLRLGKTVLPIMFIRKATTPLPISSSSSNNNNNVHIRPASTSGTVFVPTQGGQPSNTVSYNVRGRNPQFSNFMNGLMDSVAGFFGRIG